MLDNEPGATLRVQQHRPSESAPSAPDGGCVLRAFGAYPHWHAASVEYRQERLATHELLRAGFGVLAPKVRVEIRLPTGKRGTTTEPLWPGYLLFGRHDGQDWSPVFRCRGVAGAVQSIGDRYALATLPPASMAWLGEHMRDGGVVTGKTRSGRPISVPEELPGIAPGTALRVTEGPWANHTGECLWSAPQRITLLMSLFGREARVTVPREAVRIAD